MSELIDPRPVFVIVMGCNGVGKSAWKRRHYDDLPDRYFDQDAIAGGIGDWDGDDARARTRVYVDGQVDECFEQRLNFGMESTYSGRPGREMVQRAVDSGYRIEGIYFGTNEPAINAERVQWRVDSATGHFVDAKRLPERWKWSLSNLRTTADQFDALALFDNSTHDELRQPQPLEQCRLEQGRIVWRADLLELWCEQWLTKLDRRRESLERLDRKRRRAAALTDGDS